MLSGPNVHLTADAVHSAAQALLPEISLATVYNTLNELVAMGEVLEVGAGPGPKRYDPNATTPHHHLVCRSCGSLHDVFLAVDAVPDLDDRALGGFVVTGVEMVFQGICPNCAGNRAGAATPAGATGP